MNKKITASKHYFQVSKIVYASHSKLNNWDLPPIPVPFKVSDPIFLEAKQLYWRSIPCHNIS